MNKEKIKWKSWMLARWNAGKVGRYPPGQSTWCLPSLQTVTYFWDLPSADVVPFFQLFFFLFFLFLFFLSFWLKSFWVRPNDEEHLRPFYYLGTNSSNRQPPVSLVVSLVPSLPLLTRFPTLGFATFDPIVYGLARFALSFVGKGIAEQPNVAVQ